MEFLSDSVVLSRMQFALTAIFHILWPVLTTGMGIYLVIVEGVWLKTKNPDYYLHARFWSKFYVLNFGIGVATGIPMEFQFGTNWAPFSEAVGNFFGSVIGFEASWAFMLEAAFLGIMLFGWERVNPAVHYLSTILVAIGANLSTLWILTANSWMQTPAGGELVNGKFVVHDYFQAMFNPFMANSVLHMFFATLETSLFVIGGISAWYILQQRHAEFFSKSLKIALAAAIAVAPLQIYIGHLSGEQVYHYQPTKLAAMEAQWESTPAGQPADWSLLARTRLFQQPLVYIFAIIPVLGVWLIWQLLNSLSRKEERTPFVWTILLFVLSFIGLGLIVFPYIIPTKITIYEASADPSSLVIMIIFIGFLIPVMLFYNLYQYIVFRGKVTGGSYGE